MAESTLTSRLWGTCVQDKGKKQWVGHWKDLKINLAVEEICYTTEERLQLPSLPEKRKRVVISAIKMAFERFSLSSDRNICYFLIMGRKPYINIIKQFLRLKKQKFILIFQSYSERLNCLQKRFYAAPSEIESRKSEALCNGVFLYFTTEKYLLNSTL